MKKLILGIAFLLVIIVAAIVILPGLVPASAYKDKIETQLSTALDRNVTISGDVKLSVFPVLKAQTGAVQVDNADGFTDATLATMDGLDARIRLLPLLSKKIEITKFELTRPVINLEKKSDGAVNWAIGNAAAEEPKPEAEAFKRDGRFNDFNPKIGKFAITDGQITYRDQAAGKAHEITNASLSFALPSLDEIVNVDGGMTFNGTPINLDVSLDTPRHFLNGGVANFAVEAATDFARMNAKGQFTESEEIVFDTRLDGDVSDMKALIAVIPQEVPYSDLIEKGQFSGNFAYDGTKLTVKGSDLSANGNLFDAAFKGDATVYLAEGDTPPSIAGRVSADVKDVPELAKVFDQAINGIELVQTANLKADLTAKEKGFAAQNISAIVAGDGLNATYDGQADIGDAITAQGRFTATAQNLPNIVSALKLELEQEIVVDSADVRGQIDYSEELINVTLDKADVAGANLNAGYQGTVSVRGEDITANGNFTSDLRAVPILLSALKLDVPQASVVNTVKAAGSVNYAKDVIDLNLSQADVTGENLAASYTGTVGVRGTDYTAKGSFTSDLRAVPSLLTAIKVDVPQAGVLDNVKASGSVDYTKDVIAVNLTQANLNSPELVAAYTGSVNLAGEKVSTKGVLSQLDIPSVPTLAQKAGVENSAASSIGRVRLEQPVNIDYNGSQARLDNLNVTLSEGALNGGFNGNVTHILGTKPQTALNGSFRGQSASIRNLAKSFNVDLPASKTSPVFERLDTSGTIDGDLNNLNLTLSTLNIDALNATGAFRVNMSGPKPNIAGNLRLPELDARPYQAAYAPPANAPKTTGWSKTPINVDFVKNFDADIKLSAGSILTNSVNFGQSDIQTKIQNNKLTVDFPNMTLYGGRGRMNLSVDAGRRSPVLDMDINLDSLDTQSFLSKFASFASATGMGGTKFKVRGAGLSMDSIMRSLNGDGEFGVREGTIQGVNMTTLLNGFTTGLSLQSAVQGLGPGQTTQFNDLVGVFSMRNGVMTINDFDFNAVGVAAEGGGSVDLGNQSLDFRFKPRLTTSNANAIARAGIPLRISGSFSNPKTGLDQGAVSSLLAAQAQSLLQDQIGKQLGGGSAGSVLGSVLGGSNNSGSSGASGVQGALGGLLGGSQSPSQSGTTQQPSTRDVFGSILGGSQAPSQSGTTTSQTQTPQEPKPEDLAKEVFGGLFGKKKKKGN